MAYIFHQTPIVIPLHFQQVRGYWSGAAVSPVPLVEWTPEHMSLMFARTQEASHVSLLMGSFVCMWVILRVMCMHTVHVCVYVCVSLWMWLCIIYEWFGFHKLTFSKFHLLCNPEQDICVKNYTIAIYFYYTVKMFHDRMLYCHLVNLSNLIVHGNVL